MIVVGITGASGVIYGIRLLEALRELNIENALVMSDLAKVVIESETDYDVDMINGFSFVLCRLVDERLEEMCKWGDYVDVY